MTSNCLTRVICLILLSSANGLGNYKFISNAFKNSPNLKYLGDVNVWMDNQVISLNDVLGSDASKWIITRENANNVSRIAFTALSCYYSNSVIQLFKAGDYIAKQCVAARRVLYLTFDTCLVGVKSSLNTFKTTLLEIMSSTLYYSEYLNIVIDKNVLKGLLATQMYFHKSDNYYSSFTAKNNTERSLISQGVTSYIRYTFESYTNEFCLPMTSDDCEILTAIKINCSQFNFHSSGNVALREYINCLSTNLNYHLSGLKLPSSLGSIEKEYKRDLFYPDNFMLTKLLDLELIPGSNLSNPVRLRDVTLQSAFGLNTIQNIYQHTINDYHSEGVFKFQTLMIDCLSSISFYLISNIVKADLASFILPLQQVNSVEMNIIHSALEMIRSLRPGGSYLYLALKKIEYKKALGINIQDSLLESIEEYFVQVGFRNTELHTILQPLDSVYCQSIVELLDTITRNIESVKKYFFTSIPVINERLDFILLGNERFLGPSVIFSNPEINSNMKTISCDFAKYAVQHFVLGDYVLTQCVAIATKLMASFDDKLSTILIKCFDEVQKLGPSIETNFNQFYDRFLKSVAFHDKSALWANNILEFMCNLLLYLSDDRQLYSVSEHNNQRISMYLLLTGTIFKNTQRLKRFHQTLINPLEVFMNQYCPSQFCRENYTNACQFDIIPAFDCGNNDPLRTVKCLSKKILENKQHFTENFNLLGYLGTNDDRVPHSAPNEVVVNEDVVSIGRNKRSFSELMNVFSDEFRQYNNTFHEQYKLGYMMFDVIIRNSLTPLHYFVFNMDIRVKWNNSYLTIPEMYNIAKNSMTANNLVAYQIAFFDVFNFLLHGYIKKFLTTLLIPDINVTKEAIEYFIGLVTNTLSILEPIVQKYSHELIKVIITNLENYTTTSNKFGQLIDLMEKYEAESGVRRKMHFEVVGAIVESSAVVTGLSRNQQDEVQNNESLAYFSNNNDKKFITIIKSLKLFSDAVKDLYHQLYTVSDICLYMKYTNQLF